MKRIAIAAAATAVLALAAAPAHAQPRTSFSIQFGAPIAGGAIHYGSTFHGGHPYYGPRYWHRPYGPGFYGPPVVFLAPPLYYSPPTVLTVPVQPPVYIERSPPAPAPAQQAQTAYWYYCAGSQAYYPYVAECPGGWQPVPAQPSR